MKASVAFRALNNRHRAESNASKSLVVRRLNKDGTPSRAPLTASDMQLNAFSSDIAAAMRVAELEKLNPGSRFIVTVLP